MNDLSNKIRVEVAFSSDTQQKIITLELQKSINVNEAIQLSEIQDYFTQIDLSQLDKGIWGEIVKNPDERMVQDQDRIEIYRDLLIDPKQARIRRANRSNSSI